MSCCSAHTCRCWRAKATDDTLVEKLHQHHDGKSAKYKRPRIIKDDGEFAVHFAIVHYAGEVRFVPCARALLLTHRVPARLPG